MQKLNKVYFFDVRFHREDEEDRMVAHLLECHAIISDQDSEYILNFVEDDAMPEQIIQFNDTDSNDHIQYMTETYEQEVELVNQNEQDDSNPMNSTDGLSMQELHSSRMSGVWTYFEPDVSGTKVYCILCKELKLAHSYSCTSSTSNLRKHLKSFHSISVDNFKRTKVEKKEKIKKKSTVSKVWKYFSKNLSQTSDDREQDFVYCTKCLENDVQQKYRRSSSTGTLKAHLRTVHNIDLNEVAAVEEDEEDANQQDPDEPAPGHCGKLLDESPVKEKVNKRLSSARPFFQSQPDDKDYLYCILCLNDNHVHKYKTTTSTTSMKAHLMQRHQVDPDVEGLDLEEIHKDDESSKVTRAAFEVLEVPADIREAAERLTTVKSRKIRTYFMKLSEDGDLVYCAFCLAQTVKKGYKPRTSTSGLRRHLATAHAFDPLKLFQNNQVDDEDLDEEAFTDSIRNLNKNRASEVWRYFSQKEVEQSDGSMRLDTDYIYCTLCWNAPIREYQKYAISTSSGSLRRHLLSRHELLLPTMQRTRWGRREDTIEEEDEPNDDGEELADPVLIEPPPVAVKSKPKKYCRSCGRTDAGFFTKLTNLFDDADDEIIDETTTNLTLGDLYYEVTGIKIQNDDGMSQLICYMCEANLKNSFKFKKIALETEKIMYDKLQDEYVSDEPYEVYVAPPPSYARAKRRFNDFDPMADASKMIKIEEFDESSQGVVLNETPLPETKMKIQKTRNDRRITSGSSLLLKQPSTSTKNASSFVKRKFVKLVDGYEVTSSDTESTSTPLNFQSMKTAQKVEEKYGYTAASLIEEFTGDDDLTFVPTGESADNNKDGDISIPVTDVPTMVPPLDHTSSGHEDMDDYGSSMVKFVSDRSPSAFDSDHDSIVVSSNKAVEKLLDGNLISVTSMSSCSNT